MYVQPQESKSNCVKLHKDLENTGYDGIHGFWILSGNSQMWTRREFGSKMNQQEKGSAGPVPPKRPVGFTSQQDCLSIIHATVVSPEPRSTWFMSDYCFFLLALILSF